MKEPDPRLMAMKVNENFRFSNPKAYAWKRYATENDFIPENG